MTIINLEILNTSRRDRWLGLRIHLSIAHFHFKLVNRTSVNTEFFTLISFADALFKSKGSFIY